MEFFRAEFACGKTLIILFNCAKIKSGVFPYFDLCNFLTRTVVRKFQNNRPPVSAEKFSEIQIHIDYYTSIFPKSQGVFHNIAIFSDKSGFIPDRGLRK